MNHRAIPPPLAGSILSLLTLAWGGPALAAFTPNGNGTVTDSETGLVWDRCAWGQAWDGSTCTGSATSHTWAQAMDVAVTANAGSHRGQADWRVPSVAELESLVDLSRSSPAIDTTAFPNTPSANFWSSTTYVPVPANAWFISFNNGHTNASYAGFDLHVRLVRSGQSFDLLGATYAITATANPTAGGTVTCDPNPVTHGGDSTCTATANAGYTLAGFTGNCAASGNTCTFANVTAAESVTANFTLNSYAITATANPTEGGTVTCDPNPVTHGGDSTCTATANTGYTLAGFTGNCTVSGDTCTFTNMTAAESVTASFTLNSHAVTVTTTGNGSGTTSGAGTYDYGTTVNLSATPAAGSHFAGWSGDAVCAGSFPMPDQSVGCTATFTLDTYAITTGANPTAGGSVTCDANPVPHGGDSTCSLSPADGFRAATAVGGTCPAGTWQDATTYRVEAITAACSVDFAFVLDGACGAAAGTAVLTAPAGGLCAFGSPGPVTSADGVHVWSCAGDFGGNNAQCSTPGAAPGAYPGNTVTLEVAAGDGCTLDRAQLIDPPGELPAGVELPYGAVDFTLAGCTGATVTLTHAGPVDTLAFWKHVHGRWVDRMPVTLSGNQVQFTLTDGSYWDSDPRPGFIADPGGVGTALAAVPALGPWALGLLAGLLGALGLRRRFPPRRRD